MRKKVIIYGLGKAFQESRDYLYNEYEIVGLYDKDSEKEDRNISSIDEFDSIEYDFIIVTSVQNAWEIISVLEENGIPSNRIIIMHHEDAYGRLYGNTPKRGVSYAGNFEDIVIADYFTKIGVDHKDVRYLEIGVMDPVCASNTFYFYKNGGRGLLVEANPNLIDVINRVRVNDIVINKAVFEDGDYVDLYIGSDIGLSSVFKDHISSNPDWSDIVVKNKVRVSAVSINDVFEKMYSDFGRCDLLSIDIEGYDLHALSAICWDKYSPTVIVAEINQKNRSDYEDNKNIIEVLLDNNYELYANNDYNAIFTKKV